jgi:amino acid adenylation domain-containing protein
MNALELIRFFKDNSVELMIIDGNLKFKAPRGFMTPELLANIKTAKDEIIAILATSDDIRRTIPGRPADAVCVASFAQQRLWFIDQFEPGSASYNMPAALRLSGVINVLALNQTINQIVRRHETLRTSFAMLDDTLTQVIAPTLKLPVAVTDLGHLPPLEREQRARSMVQDEAQMPFDLASGPLVRASLIRMHQTEHILLFTLHHIVSDGWSMGVLVREVATLYAAYVATSTPPLAALPELPIQYADFAHWQRQWISGEVLDAQTAYWKEQLKESPVLLALPTDRPRPPQQSHRGAIFPFVIASDTTAKLHALSRSAQGTLFMTLTAAFNVLLARYTGQSDICIGTPIANRNRAEIEPLIGFFVNTLVLRTQVDSHQSFSQLLQQVRSTTLDAYSHQDLPFEQLVETLRPERHASHSPLFQVVLALQNAPMGSLDLPGLTLEPLAADGISAKFDLILTLTEHKDQLFAAFEYKTDLFDQTTIERMAGHFTHLLEAITADPTALVGTLSMLGEAEKHRMLVEWNDTTTHYPATTTIHQWFETQVVKTPDHVALVYEDTELSYAALNARANQLAHYLRGIGVGPDILVGICAQRSLDMIIGLLGILKAGGAYVPLDPFYPPERLAYMIADARPLVLLTQQHLQSALPDNAARLNTFLLDADWHKLEQQACGNPEALALPGNLAYVIYTSGSTGQPKGVLLKHDGLCKLMQAQADSLAVLSSQRVLQFASFNFDASTWEIFTALCSGAALCLANRDQLMPGMGLTQTMQRLAINLALLPPVALAVLVPAELPLLQTLVVGGEACSHALARQWSDRQRLMNAYGPTEATVYALSYFCDATLAGAPPIGRPIANTRIYLLDSHLNPVPVGVTGQLYIAGDGLARGYLNRPDLTADKFIPNPFCDEHDGMPGARMYQTGDLARYCVDGVIEYMGRIDDQIKIRGFRIELGEIEAALTALPAIREAVVILREDEPGDKRLVAYLVPDTALMSHMPPTQGDEALDHTENWGAIFDKIYAEGGTGAANDGADRHASHAGPAESAEPEEQNDDRTFDTAGWDSNYDHQPIPAQQMREWVGQTVKRILALQPQQVLEIGFGTGLLLHRVAPNCRRYLGIDPSQVALEHIQQQLQTRPYPGCEVRLARLAAHQLRRLPDCSFDTLVINSVIQYFPSVAYLTQVLQAAIDVCHTPVGPTGNKPAPARFFIGDVRHLGLLRAFHTSIALYQAGETQTMANLRHNIAQAVRTEAELFIDPAYFFALQHHCPQITRIEIIPKMQHSDNELVRFRYDVVLTVDATVGAIGATITDAAAPIALSPSWQSWAALPDGMVSLDAALQKAAQTGQLFAVRDLPNAMVAPESRAMALISTSDDGTDIRQLRQQIAAQPDNQVPDWQALQMLAARYGYLLQLSLASSSGDTIHAVFSRHALIIDWRSVLEPDRARADLAQFANRPFSARARLDLQAQVMAPLARMLPNYMIPTHFVELDTLPLSANGKIDRKVLPLPAVVRSETGYCAPRTPAQQLLAQIWADVLKLDRVGIHDNFFALGGHSLLAIQLITRIRTVFHIELAVRVLFEASTVEVLAQRIELMRQKQAGVIVPPIVKIERKGALPLSFAQQRLWFLDQFEPGSAFYNIPAALRLNGLLDTLALTRTINEVVRRHEALRTNFSMIDGKASQVIAPKLEIVIEISDLCHLPPIEREQRAREITRNEAQMPFNLASAPLIRTGLIRMQEKEHILLLTLHHIVYDGWSMGVLVQEVAALYAAYVQNRASPLPELAIQYADFAHWQRQWLKGEVLDAQSAYWKAQLAGSPTLLTLPTDRPRPPVQTHRGATSGFVIDVDVTTRLHAISHHAQVTLFMTLMAAFNVLLSRYTGQSDICIGTPIAGRNRAEIEPLIGFFVNTLVLRTRIDNHAAFSQLLQQVRSTTLDAYGHQDIPFEQLVELLKPERHPGHAPIFQVMLALQNAPMSSLSLPDLTLEPLGANGASAKFDLTLNIMQQSSAGGERLFASFEYNTDLFDAATIERMAGHFTHLLEAIGTDPDVCVGSLPMLSQAEKNQLLLEWNDTAADYPKTATIHQLFEAQVLKTPNSVALVFEGAELTYAALNAKANQLAHHLRGLGVGPDVLVAICAQRSLDMIVGLLGIIKAGGAYLPLDPSYPEERLAYMLDDARPLVVLTQQNLLGTLPLGAIPTRCLDSEWAQISGSGDANPVNLTRPGNLAYVVYTSGSTGRPKGVLITHQAVNRLVFDEQYLHLRAEDRVGQAANSSFDAITFEVWGALLHGCQLNIIPYEVLLSTSAFAASIQQQKITTMFLTTALFNQIAFEAPATFSGFFNLLFGGDSVDPRPVGTVLREGAPNRLLHVYGPTESTTFALWYWVRELNSDERTIPVGRPISNTRIYLLDANLNPVPVGVAGQLHIGGDGLARGYLNRPDLTADKFIPDPFCHEPGRQPGSRLYKSGDLARYLPDGNIEFLGRIDNQVKIRGFRIELGEIEAALAALPMVREAVVLAREDVPGDKRLVAWVIPQTAGETLKVEQLRSALQQSLPDYMIPMHFMVQDSFPLTPNGKIDRKALPAPDSVRSEDDYCAPRTPTETVLAAIWADVLKLDRVGIHDNFFTLGGHSLLATQLITRIRTVFQSELPLRALFEAPEVEALARRIELARQQQMELMAPPIIHTRRDGPVPLSFAQQRLWFLDQLEPANASYNIPTALRLSGKLHLPALTRTINEIIRRHEALRTSFAMIEGAPMQVIAPELAISIEIADLGNLPPLEREQRAQAMVHEEAQTPFDLASVPLVRSSLIRMQEQDHILLFTVHHIVSDGWSMGVLVREVAALYAACVENQASPLPELIIQYADFAHWQRQWLQGAVLDAQTAYWKKHLTGSPTLLALPTDQPRPPVQSHHGATLTFVINSPLTAKLHAISREAQTTLFMTLAAAFNVLLSRYSGETDICIGTPIANRNRAEIEPLIGFFVNTLVLRTQINSHQLFGQLLQQMRNTTLDAYAYQDVPFEQLVEILMPERHASHSPLFQVMLIVQNAPISILHLPGLTFTPLAASGETAKFDLTLNITEGDGRLFASFEYNTDLFNEATIQRMAGHFTRLLEALDLQTRISALTILDEAEKRQLLVEWNDTAADYPETQTVHQLFEAQVLKTPNQTALIYEGVELSYTSLNAKANQLAHHLRSMGVGPDVPVGICVERSLAMVVGLLGILKAGGVYVPLDSSYPQDRLAYMLSDAAPVLLLTQQHLLDTVSANGIPTLCLDSQWARLQENSSANLQNTAFQGNLAYVIYTSGSTGLPKGVGVTLEGLKNRLHWFAPFLQKAGVHDAPVTALKTNIGFADSITEVLATLLMGGRLVVFKREAVLNIDLFDQSIKQYGISNLVVVPSFLGHILTFKPAALDSIKTLVCSGEALSPELIRKARAAYPRLQLFNFYGSSEANGDSIVYRCFEQNDGAALNRSIIGKPIANTQIYLLDADLNPVPPGAAGELHIAGIGLARGYLGRPDLTADKFIPNPFGSEPGARMYKSGDLARYDEDGNIEYLGRRDDQVKIRGFRIELGEIEAALAALPMVRKAIVLAREDNPGDRRLAAYIVAEASDGALEAAALRAALAQSLPDYMVPAHFMILEKLPLTPNGKIDRKALPAPDMVRSEQGYTAPRTPTEAALAEIWANVLRLDQVGIHDNFFSLGGHSLLATQLITRIRTVLNCELPLRALFEAPEVAGLAHKIELARQQQTGSCAAMAPPVIRVERNGPLPLSFAQQRLWFIDQFEPGSASYNMPVALRLSGMLAIPALSQAINEIIRRHEALRTRFVMIDGVPAQVIAAQMQAEIKLTDLCHLPHAEGEARAQVLAQEEAQTPFDLASGPLVRAGLIRMHDTEHILLFTLHHIVSDGWSMGVLVQEVAALYAAYVENRASPLPELSIQYADFAHWQRQWLSGDVLDSQTRYWQQQLKDSPVLLALPTDRPRPAVQTHRGATLPFIIAPDTTARLHAVSLQARATLFMILSAALNVLLSRHTGQSDICIGTPIANRNRAEIEPLIGFFVNTLVLRTQVDSNQTFEQLLQQVHATTLDAWAHQDVPFEQLVEVLRPARHLGHSPLFQVMLVLQNAPMDTLRLPGLTLAPFAGKNVNADVHTKFDLTLNIAEASDPDNSEQRSQLFAMFEYNRDLFDQATIGRMAGHFTRLLEAIVADPSARIGTLSMLSEAEKNQMLTEWNHTATVYPRIGTIHQLFEAQALKTPDNVAVLFEDTRLSYAELNAKANRLAHHLRSLGAGPDALVGICALRSPGVIIAMLGILKAGAAYMSLDPAHPKQRLKYMLDQARPCVLLTQQPLLELMPENNIPTLCMDSQEPLFCTHSTANPPNIALPDNLAYVIHTSGSTGKPKGVLLRHQGLVNLIQAQTSEFAIQAGQRMLQLASFNFDVSTWETFLALCSGATLCLATPEQLMPGASLSHTLQHLAINMVAMTPVMLGTLEPDALPLLHTIIVGGEACPPGLIRQWATHRRLMNAYGPTETTVCAANQRCHADEASPPPIGHPLSNVKIYLLDADLNPVPVGVAGELHIGGDGLARGYLNQPDLTADKFIPDPFCHEPDRQPGSRLYKSGDLARYLPDGKIEFLGRIDNQVKIRGLRIEPGEIEAALTALPAVREAIVLVREDLPGDKRLVAWITTHTANTAHTAQTPDSKLDTSALRSALLQSLPDYMVPAHFMVLDSFPVTANGKIDRAALQASNLVRSEPFYLAPQSASEFAIAAIWQQLLGFDKIGRHDNFFELGGHSILALQMTARAGKVLGRDIPVREIFAHQTLYRFAAAIDDRSLSTHGSNLVPIRPDGILRPLFFIHAGGGEVGYAHQLAPWLDVALPIYGLAASGFASSETPLETVQEMAALYIQAMRQVQSEGPYRVAGWSAGGSIAFEIANQLIHAGNNVEFVGLIDTYHHVTKTAEPNEADFFMNFMLTSIPETLRDELKELAVLGDIDQMFVRCQEFQVFSKDFDTATFRRHLAVLHRIALAAMRYSAPAIPLPITLFTADHEDTADQTLGWKEVPDIQLQISHIGGSHLSMMELPHGQKLGAAISEALHGVAVLSESKNNE